MARKVFDEMLVVAVLLCFFGLGEVCGDVGTATSYDPPYIRERLISCSILFDFWKQVNACDLMYVFFFFDFYFSATKCPGYDQDRLPGNGLFVAAGDGIWDNGAACGRKYQLRCLSGVGRPCKDGSIVVEVVDFCRVRPCPSTLVLSNRAFDAVSKIPHARINVEFAQ
ncbi:EG45-like domain containing protein [Canna indica]|uniref:EG45-like domain containing protein n=1 Tax=Canna indica TaxID=4628 RepID=A0AAQ3KK11_9LILI|nr:EG45-like domain containing protein [Canna indica]